MINSVKFLLALWLCLKHLLAHWASMKTQMKTLVALTWLLSVAASAAQPRQPRQPSTLPDGIWQNPGYGYVLQSKANKAQLFDLSDAGCVLQDRFSADQLVAILGPVNHKAINHKGNELRFEGLTPYRFDQIAALPAACEKKALLKGSEALVNTKVMLATLKQFEIDSAARGLDYPALEKEFLAKAKTTRDAKATWQLLAEIVRRSKDPHVSIAKRDDEMSGKSERESNFEKTHGADSTTVRKNLKAYLLGSETPLVSELQVIGNRKIAWGYLPNKIAYIVPLAMGGYVDGLDESAGANAHAAASAAVLESLLTTIKDAKGVILDLRYNQGGFDQVALAWATRFTDVPITVGKKSAGNQTATDIVLQPTGGQQYLGPVMTLIGNYTVSAGETAALAMAAIPRVTLIGEPTQGAFSDAIPKRLPNGWQFTVSIERYQSPDGSNLELHGVQPDMPSNLGDRKTDAARYGEEINQAMAVILSRTRP